MKKRSVAVFSALTCTLLLSACSASGDDKSDTNAETIQIGYAAMTTKEEFTSTIINTLEDEAPEFGATVLALDSRMDTSFELSNVEDLITRQVDAVIMQPIDGKASQSAAKRVIDAGIPLFIISTEFAEGATVDFESHIGVDDTDAGRLQGEYLNEQLPDGGDIVLIAGTNGASWTDRRISGFENAINPNITVVAEFQGNGNRDEAKRGMEDTLQRYTDPGSIDAVVANNDEMAVGAALAIAEAGRTSEFSAIVGVDGTAAALDLIRDGKMTATVKQDPRAQAQEALNVITDFLKGDDTEDRYALPFTLITSENLDNE
ncbi:ribose transport system substrate-binding protein/inositol transport system substrate-binding protein [Leucobacter luti]|uniref:Ribose transport system substrate-binding protein/inositol transport system substrate-binding protein n=1 Tax=Leucobacter luti TaxID=340320 RepID=A0A4R6RSB2_9MICO|nr:sugar ABC transporter substrate-binding protein [Leucobacter luti]TDP89743.1 ribose transport system substrate-binding protein/inositol transport system substrate-binding protein [Leucobacter luti]